MADFLNVNKVLDNLDLKETMTAAEFGCGSADFSIALAKKLRKGRVYALDIQEEKLSAPKSKLALEGLNNVVMVVCDLEAPSGSTLQGNSQDVVLIPNVLFQAENKYAILKEAHRVLKVGGTLLVIDWFKKVPFSPKTGMVTPDEVKKLAATLAFSLTKEFMAGDYHFALLFAKT